MKKIVSLLLVLTLAISLLIGCTSKEPTNNPSSSSEPESQVENSNLTAPGTFPIVKDKVTIKVYTALQDDMSKNWFTQVYEEKTNVHIEWMSASFEEYKNKLSIMFASKEKFDLISGPNNGLTRFDRIEVNKFGLQGVVMRLNELIDTQGYYLKELYDANPDGVNTLRSVDGSIYSFGTFAIGAGFHPQFPHKMWVNKTFLDNLGLKVPTTTDEFYDMLVAFKTKDANKNGDPNDEIPFSSVKQGSNVNFDGFLMNAFTYCDNNAAFGRMRVNKGKIEASFVVDEYKEGMKYLRKLYADGLIYPESFTQDQATQRNLNESGEYRRIGASLGMHPGYISAIGQTETWKEYIAIPPLKGPNGFVTASYGEYNNYEVGKTMISATSENPEVAFRIIDGLYDKETAIESVNGKKDLHWRYAVAGELGKDGKPAEITRLSVPQDHPFYQTYTSLIWEGLSVYPLNHSAYTATNDVYAPDNAGFERFLYLMSEPYAAVHEPLENTIPPLCYSEENIKRIAQLKVPIEDYVNESVARFIIGDLDIEKDWSTYLNNLENLGLQEYINIMQTTYDEYYKK